MLTPTFKAVYIRVRISADLCIDHGVFIGDAGVLSMVFGFDCSAPLVII